jgi:hypothetical protein
VSPHLTTQQGSQLVIYLILALCLQLSGIGYVFYTSYAGRVDLVNAQRSGCERSKLDRQSNAIGWRIAQDARRASGDIAVSIRYGDIAYDLERRSELDCTTVYPDARWIP